ncbi:hypothetical protein [Tropicibacter sp. S64]|uniref:hypothetical protein n=1 Tax=Tropicibacter sp. S64 TaxID=3415122 RepID=UPI003C7C8408
MTNPVSDWREALLAILDTLRSHAFPFAAETEGREPMEPASDAAKRALDTVDSLGRLPEHYRSAVETLGNVDLRHARPHDPSAPLRALATFDPFVFQPDYLAADMADPDIFEQQRADHGAVFIEFAMDACHKADVSGGSGYGFWLPVKEHSNPPQPDQLLFPDLDLPALQVLRPEALRIEPVALPFAAYVETTLRNGGFFGQYSLSCDGNADYDARAIATRNLGSGPAFDALRHAAALYLPRTQP